jgi:hypothetical protein
MIHSLSDEPLGYLAGEFLQKEPRYFFGVSGGIGGSGWLPNSMRTADIPRGRIIDIVGSKLLQ